MNLDTNLDLENLSSEQRAMLRDLQPNIVQAHTRDHCYLFPLRFTEPVGARTFLRKIASQMKTADAHLIEVEAHRNDASVKSDKPYIGVHLTASGYAALGVAELAPTDAAFRGGMAARGVLLNDPFEGDWESRYRADARLHALVIVGGGTDDASIANTDNAAELLFASLGGGVELTGLPEIGAGIGSLKAPGQGIEHFGYVDGRSQPLFTKQSLKQEEEKNALLVDLPSDKGSWSAEFKLRQVLVKDPGSVAETAHGSYFVYRKLEQNVRKFKAREQELANAFNLVGNDRERMGASIVGRFEDGTPYTLKDRDGFNAPVPNDFNYLVDVQGLKCPFHAHIRKTNPRGSDPGTDDRKTIMARRGVTYGRRDVHPNDPALAIEDMPTKNVGLLFMAYQADIAQQFEVTQRFWANNKTFPSTPPGAPAPDIDPVIGQLAGGAIANQVHRQFWNDAASPTLAMDFANFVTMKGGDYFFAPAISTLKSLPA